MARNTTFVQISSTPYTFPNYKTATRIEVSEVIDEYLHLTRNNDSNYSSMPWYTFDILEVWYFNMQHLVG